MLVGVSVYIGRGVYIYWWGYLCILVGVFLYDDGGISACW